MERESHIVMSSESFISSNDGQSAHGTPFSTYRRLGGMPDIKTNSIFLTFRKSTVCPLLCIASTIIFSLLDSSRNHSSIALIVRCSCLFIVLLFAYNVPLLLQFYSQLRLNNRANRNPHQILQACLHTGRLSLHPMCREHNQYCHNMSLVDIPSL